MLEYTLSQAFNMAGVDATDSDWVRDAKFSTWIGKRKWVLIDHGQDSYRSKVEQAKVDGVDVLIIKGTSNDKS